MGLILRISRGLVTSPSLGSSSPIAAKYGAARCASRAARFASMTLF